MIEPTVVLNFPKEKCTDIVFKGAPFVQIDTGMTAEELVTMLLRWSASDDKVAVVKEVKE